MAERNPKLVLDTEQLTEDFFANTRLLGIMAPVRDYQFCWYLNNATGLSFRINNDLEIQLTRKKRNYFFAVYEYNEPSKFLSHYVYCNQYDGEYLLPEFKHLDFLWLMKGDEITDDTLQETIQIIKAISNVQLVVELTNEKIKNKEHLVF
jgi:hypothetical protein